MAEVEDVPEYARDSMPPLPPWERQLVLPTWFEVLGTIVIVVYLYWHVWYYGRPHMRVYAASIHPNRWKLWPFFTYYVILFVFFCWGLPAGTRLIKYTEGYMDGVQPGWWRGNDVDVSDPQYSGFRNNFPILFVGMAIYLLGSNIVHWPWLRRDPAAAAVPLTEPVGREPSGKGAVVRKIYYVAIGLPVLFILHGHDAIWVLSAMLVNYTIAKMLAGSRIGPFVIWAFCLTVKFSADYYGGYKFHWLSPELAWIDDTFDGLYRWTVQFNITMLRMISFSMDYHWLVTGRKPLLKIAQRNDYDRRTQFSLKSSQYGLLDYMAYMLYFPLYIGGPIVTFNAYVSQVNQPQLSVPMKKVFRGFARMLFIFLVIDFAQHNNQLISLYFHYAEEKTAGESGFYTGIMKQLESSLVAGVGFWFLQFTYLKFLVLWRFFRLMALFDGIDSVDNMPRCVNDHFSFVTFWRTWHSSMYQWTLRYMYMPFGGRKYQIITIWPIFLFIGLFHDLLWKWVAWALVNCCFFALEIVVTALFTEGAVKRYFPRQLWFLDMTWMNHPKHAWWSFYVYSLGTTANIFFLMFAQSALMLGFSGTVEYLSLIWLADGPFYSLVYFIFVWGFSLAIRQWRVTRAYIRMGRPHNQGPDGLDLSILATWYPDKYGPSSAKKLD